MVDIAVKNLTKFFVIGDNLLDGLTFEVQEGECVAILGRNGCGKTTLFNILTGQMDYDDGEVFVNPDKKLGLISQIPRFPAGYTVEDVLRSAFSELIRLQEKMKQMEESMSSSITDQQLKEYDSMSNRFQSGGGYNMDVEVDKICNGLGISPQQKKQLFDNLSGGEKTRVNLARLLLEKTDILLLDEPTNHLDGAAVEWLEQYLKTYSRAVVMVSHDRFFMDETAEVVYELEDAHLTRYPGNYTQYRIQKRKQLERQRKTYERMQEEQKRLEALIERFKHKPKKAAFARAKKKALERLVPIEKPKEEGPVLFVGETEPLIPGSKRVLEPEKLKIGYDRVLLEITVSVRKGQKIAILGENGTGKSTFLKTVAGILPLLGGSCVLGNHTTIGYFDQHSAEIDSGKPVLEHFHELFPGMTEKEVRSLLGAYLFSGKDAAKRVCDLSGG